MEPQRNRVRIELTDLQKKQIKEESGQDVEALEFDRKELEERIAPVVRYK